MGEDSKICRLCLQILGQDVPYSALTNDSALLDRLNLISFNTTKNLDLIEDSLICDPCTNKVKDLSYFKQYVIANQFKIQCYSETELEAFLQTLSEDVDQICRLCLKAKEGQKNFDGCEALLEQCNVHMNLTISAPSKLCYDCDMVLHAMVEFVSLCSKNESLILELATSNNGKLASKDLIGAIAAKAKASESIKTEDDNSLTKISRKPKGVKKKVASNESVSNTIDEYMIKNNMEGNSPAQQQESFNITRTPNTYKSKKMFISSDMPSTSKTQTPLDKKLILKKMNEQLKQMHGSIDTLPLSDLADITLHVNEDGKVQEDCANECNVTQELIDVLEGRLNDKNINFATQELLDVLEGRSEDDDEVNRDNIVVTVEIEPKASKETNNKAMNIIQVVTIGSKNDSNKPTEEKRRSRLGQKPIENLEAKRTTRTATRNNISKPVKTAREGEASKKAVSKKRNETTTTEQPKKKMKRAPIKNEPTEAKTDGSSDDDGDGDDLFEEDASKKLNNKPVTVTIIKSKKRTNKAQLDKTWHELTGKPLAGESNNANNTGDIQALEIKLVQKKRGRPPLPAHQRKSLKAKKKKQVLWMHCNTCPFKTYARNSFIQHQLIHNVMSSVSALNCDSCRFTTTDTDLLAQHKSTHAAQNLTYKCIFCDEVFKKKSSCMYHTLRHDDKDVASQFYCMAYNGNTDEEYFECYQCDYQNMEESPMPDHVIDHTIEKPKNPLIAKFKCNQCPYRTKSEELLKRHKDMHLVEGKKKNRKLHAPSAATIKEEPEEDAQLDEGEEAEQPVLKCDKCHYVTRNKRSLTNHKGLKHNRQATPQELGEAATAKLENQEMYYCNECSYSTHRKLNMPRHALVHRTKENMEFMECPHCLFETKHRRSYTRHMEASHGVII